LRGAIGSGITHLCNLGYEERKGYASAGELAANWAAGKKAKQKEVAAALQKAQLTMEDVAETPREPFMPQSCPGARFRVGAGQGGAAPPTSPVSTSWNSRPELHRSLVAPRCRELRGDARSPAERCCGGPPNLQASGRSAQMSRFWPRAQNAFRHGLNPVRLDLCAPKIEAMARRKSPLRGRRETVEGARWVAEAQFDLTACGTVVDF
jgi:hypothetical protein